MKLNSFIKKELVSNLKKIDPEKVILFGSYSNDKANEESDIDLYIVTKDEFIPQTYREKRDLVRKVSECIIEVRQKIAIDLLVHTKLMSEKFELIGGSFAKEIFENGQRLT